jgi:hypothetical protein
MKKARQAADQPRSEADRLRDHLQPGFSHFGPTAQAGATPSTPDQRPHVKKRRSAGGLAGDIFSLNSAWPQLTLDRPAGMVQPHGDGVNANEPSCRSSQLLRPPSGLGDAVASSWSRTGGHCAQRGWPAPVSATSIRAGKKAHPYAQEGPTTCSGLRRGCTAPGDTVQRCQLPSSGLPVGRWDRLSSPRSGYHQAATTGSAVQFGDG